MTDLAMQARENAISLEVKKDGLQQRQSGDWMLRFTVAAIEMDRRITDAPMGTRFACVLVEVNDDETPTNHVARERDKWRDLGPAKQAGMRCKEPAFWAFLSEELHLPEITKEEHAASAVREICRVMSRADFDKPGQHEARIMWHQLDNAYQAWKARENVR